MSSMRADPGRHRLQEPDVRDRRREVDVAHALAAHLALDHLDAALLADDAAILHALVLAAQALVVLDRPEDPGAEQAVPLGLERAVVDRLGLLDLAIGPRPDLLRAGDRDLDLIELQGAARLPEEVHQLVHVPLLSIDPDEPACRPAADAGDQSSPVFLLELDVQAERLQLLDQHVEGLGNARLEGVLAAHDRLVDLGPARRRRRT